MIVYILLPDLTYTQYYTSSPLVPFNQAPRGLPDLITIAKVLSISALPDNQSAAGKC